MAKSNKSEIGTVGFASPKIFRDYAPALNQKDGYPLSILKAKRLPSRGPSV